MLSNTGMSTRTCFRIIPSPQAARALAIGMSFSMSALYALGPTRDIGTGELVMLKAHGSFEHPRDFRLKNPSKRLYRQRHELPEGFSRRRSGGVGSRHHCRWESTDTGGLL